MRGALAAMVSMEDLADRPPRGLGDGERLIAEWLVHFDSNALHGGGEPDLDVDLRVDAGRRERGGQLVEQVADIAYESS